MITVPTRAQILAQVLANLKGERPQIDTAKGSPEWARLNALVEALYGIFWNVRAVQGDIWPGADTPTDSLEKHALLRLGTDGRRGPTIASGTNACRVTGVLAGAAVTAGLALAHSDGTRFRLTEGATIGVGTADLSIEAITKGAVGNKNTGDTLTLESPPANITADTLLVADLTDGSDGETDAELLERVIFAYRNPPAGGRFSDYWDWAMSVNGVAGAYIYGPSSYALTGRRGLGIVDIAILAAGSGSDRIPSAAFVLAAQDFIDSVRPSPARDTKVWAARALTQAVDVKLTPAQGYEWDWTAAGGGHQISSWTLGTLTIVWNTALPATLMAAVDAGLPARIYTAGQLFTVVSYNSGAHSTVIDETPTHTPIATDPIYPGGPLSAAARLAILNHMDTLGPARATYADPNQWWEDTLRITKLASVLVWRKHSDGTPCGVEGCNEATVVTPGSNVTPTDPTPTTYGPYLVVPGEVTVRPV